MAINNITKIDTLGFSNQFKIETNVLFLDKPKAQQYFINSEWSEVYYKYKSLTELSEQIVRDLMSVDRAIYNNKKEFNYCKAIEGFTVFIEMKNGAKNQWVSHCDDYGTIQVSISLPTKINV